MIDRFLAQQSRVPELYNIRAYELCSYVRGYRKGVNLQPLGYAIVTLAAGQLKK